MSVEWGRKQERLTAEHFPGLLSNSNLGRGCCSGEPKKIRLIVLSLGRVATFQFHGYSLCPFLVSNINFPLQSRELLHDRIHIAVNRLSLNADRSSHCFQSWRAALWGFGQLFPFSEFFDNPGQSLIQSAKYLLSWFWIGRYLHRFPRTQCVNCVERPVDQIHNLSFSLESCAERVSQ